MSCTRGIIVALLLAGVSVLSALASSAVLAGGFTPASATCPRGTACDSTLGVAIVLPRGWSRLPEGRYPPHALAFANGSKGLNYNVRLVIEPYALTSVGNDRLAAQNVAVKVISTERARSTTQAPVTYAGAPGVLIRGLPGGNGPAADIILAHRGAVYLLIAAGASLAPDQTQALRSMRFIPRHGAFLPPAHGGR